MIAPAGVAEEARILLVDDREENLFALEAILEPLGYAMVRATSGEEALRELLRRDFAVILLDVQMPGLSGFETAKLIKARERSRDTPIIFLTAISSEEAYVFEGYSVGAVDYLAKPFQPDILRSKVSVFVDLYLKTQRLQQQEQLLRESERREMELRHRAELGESEARAAQIVSSAMDAIIAFDADLQVTLFNAAAERMFERPADDALGLPITTFLPTLPVEQLDSLCGISPGALETGPLADDALEGERLGGERFPVEFSLSCLKLAAGRVFTVIVRDISERRRQARSLEKAMGELRALNEALSERQRELEHAMNARSRFYASMSHELRTPINAIIGYNSLLLENIYGPLNERQVNGIERSHKAANHLLELVNDVLDLSKIEAGKIELQVEPVSIPAVIEDLFSTVRPLADEHGITLSLEKLGEIRRVVSDPRRVRQILLNLLSNAIKFGENHPIEVSCTALDEGGVRVEVVDHGAGISPEDQEKIFDEFVQLDAGGQPQGTGLGLAISRRLAELLNGSLEVESRIGEGSTFRLTLPASVEALPPPPEMHANGNGAGHLEPAPR